MTKPGTTARTESLVTRVEDWLAGGTGRDIYGGFGNDLLNADDYLDTETNETDNKDTVNSPFDNEAPDTQPSYEDRAYGGAGRDVLIGNTGGDRLMDWVGEFTITSFRSLRFAWPPSVAHCNRNWRNFCMPESSTKNPIRPDSWILMEMQAWRSAEANRRAN